MMDFMTGEVVPQYNPLKDKLLDVQIAEQLAQFYADPLGFVMWAFPWGEGELEGFNGPDTWQLDVLTEIGEQVKTRGFDGVNPVRPIREATSSGHGIGKILSNIIDLDTPDGVKSWGDIDVGSRVFGSDGKPTTVTAKYPYTDWDFYKVTFSDGTSTFAGKEHQWQVTTESDRSTHRKPRVVTTEEMMGNLHRRYQIPITEPVDYECKDVPLNPYLVGYLLGNGNLRTSSAVRVSCFDPEIYSYINNHLPDGMALAGKDKNYQHISKVVNDNTPNKVVQCLSRLNLKGLKSSEKFVPDVYKYNTAEVRLQVLRGLMDSDGTVSPRKGRKGYKVNFSTSSPRLRDDVVWIVKSLGGVCNYSTDGRRDNLATCDNYEVHVNLPRNINPFMVKRKRDMYEDYAATVKRNPIKVVHSIEYDHTGPGHCITVSAENSLYLANDFIVTHNSALTSWLILWIMATRMYAKGVVTANTGDQLKTKTWGEVGKWMNRSILTRWFEYNNSKGNMHLYHKNYPESWRVDAQTCREENSESFAGLHSASSTPFYIFDEASAVPDKIWEVAEGGLTDGEPMFFVFGNPTRNTGKFAEIFKRQRHVWNCRQIDSRTAKMTNKELFKEWEDTWGEDSDFFRVRVRGVFPRASDVQFIPGDAVSQAQKRVPRYLGDDPLICGVDVARGGGDECVVQFRRGKDAKSEKVYKIPGEKSRDSMKLISILTTIFNDHQPDVINIDETGLGGPIVDRLNQLGWMVNGVNFGAKATDEKHYVNRVAEMWARMRQWLMSGGSIHSDPQLETELTEREYSHDSKDRLVLESKDQLKKRGMSSPDWGDALALTFAIDVPKLPNGAQRGERDNIPGLRNTSNNWDYDPLDSL